jgi:hypothetical protein
VSPYLRKWRGRTITASPLRSGGNKQCTGYEGLVPSLFDVFQGRICFEKEGVAIIIIIHLSSIAHFLFSDNGNCRRGNEFMNLSHHDCKQSFFFSHIHLLAPISPFPLTAPPFLSDKLPLTHATQQPPPLGPWHTLIVCCLFVCLSLGWCGSTAASEEICLFWDTLPLSPLLKGETGVGHF